MTHEDNVLVASRRRLLALAGCFAAAPSVALASPSEAPTPDDGLSRIDPYFIETKAEIDRHHARWMDLNEDDKARRRVLRRWEEHHPEPSRLCASTIQSAWLHRQQNVMRSLDLAAIGAERNAAARAYTRAATDFAAMEADNLAELLFKVQAAAITDTQDNKIARSVLFDILILGRHGEFSYRAASAA